MFAIGVERWKKGWGLVCLQRDNSFKKKKKVLDDFLSIRMLAWVRVSWASGYLKNRPVAKQGLPLPSGRCGSRSSNAKEMPFAFGAIGTVSQELVIREFGMQGSGFLEGC
jgi:hypothetical protein